MICGLFSPMAAGTAAAPCLNEPWRDSVALVAQLWSERVWCRRCCCGLQRGSSRFMGSGSSGWWDLCRGYGVQGILLEWSGLYLSWRANAPLGLGQHDIYWEASMWKKHLPFLINLHLLMNFQIASVFWVVSWHPWSYSPDSFCFHLGLSTPSSPWGSSVHGRDVFCSHQVSLCPTLVLL